MAASAPLQLWVRQQTPNKSDHSVITAPLLVRAQRAVAGAAAVDVRPAAAGYAVDLLNATIMDWSTGRRMLSVGWFQRRVFELESMRYCAGATLI